MCYVSRQYLSLNMRMAVYYITTTFPLEVFTQGNVVEDFTRLKLNDCILRTKNRFLSTIWGFIGNVRTPSIARWKAEGRLPIFVIIQLFSLSVRPTVEML